jgi:aryl-alcohol dehydrogenase-like predicted oxidoreductase
MRYQPLGSTGMNVSSLCLGTMSFGAWGNRDHDDCVRVIRSALDQGVNFVDTADVYSRGEAEGIVGQALKGRRDDVVLATKVSAPMSEDPNHRGNSRRWITREIEASLRRLGTDHVDLYQIHRPDPGTDIDETLSVLSDLISAGKVRAIGCSAFPAEQIVEAHWAAARRGRERFRCEQPPYSVFDRQVEASVLPTAERYGMGVITYGPLANGWLSGRYRTEADIDLTAGRPARRPGRFDPALATTQRKLELVAELDQVAADAGISLLHLAIAFVTSHRAVTSAIIGPRTQEQADGLLAGQDVVLDAATLDRIDQIVAPGTAVAAERPWTPPALASPALRRRRLHGAGGAASYMVPKVPRQGVTGRGSGR